MDLPIKVECGTAGKPVNRLKFIQDMPKKSTFEHKATDETELPWAYPAGGYIIVWMEAFGRMSSDSKEILKCLSSLFQTCLLVTARLPFWKSTATHSL